MEGLQLSEAEQRYFGDLFLCCDSENAGKIPFYRASELLRSANIPLDILKQILELSGVGHGTHFGRRQFYAALKLVAAFQAGLPLCQELVHAAMEIPLPRFSWTAEIGKWQHGNQHITSPDLIQLSDTDRTPTPQRENATEPVRGKELIDSPEAVNSTSPKRESPEVSSTASDSPTPTNSVQEKNWAATHWKGLVACEEQRQLLGTEEESSDRHSSEEEDIGDVWTITEEQRDYYNAQFRSLQPDPNGLIAGPVARLFFEKSRLPVQELRKIWQLADVSKDGALSLEEFNTAMHLVVLRRNNIELPDTLPPNLVPQRTANHEERSPSSPATDAASPPRNKEWTKFVDSPTSSISSPGPKPVNFDFHKSAVEQDPKILHPVPLRVTPESQGLAPAEDDVLRSPRKPTDPIPYEQLSSGGSGDQGSPKKGASHGTVVDGDIRPIQRPQAKKPAVTWPRLPASFSIAPGPGAIPPPPQPVIPVEESTNQGGSSGPTSLPVSIASAQMPQGPKKEPPPPPPPRPYRTHTRSSSLDLNRLGKGGVQLGAPPVVPPRISPSTTSPKKLIGQRSEGDVLSLVADQPEFADFAQFGQDEEKSDTIQPRKHGAFEVYRKPLNKHEPVAVVHQENSPENETSRSRQLSEPEGPAGRPQDQRHVVQQNIRQLQEHNSRLTRLCQELNEELSEIQKERVTLEAQLEQLRILTD